MNNNQFPKVDIHLGDSRNMSKIASNSVNLIVTSPPYGALKDYENDKQIGKTQAYNEYIENLNKVWDECEVGS